MSLRTLAARLDEPYSSFTNRITENRIPKKSGLIEAMARELGCSIEYLTTGKQSMEEDPDLNELISLYSVLTPKMRNIAKTILRALKEG